MQWIPVRFYEMGDILRWIKKLLTDIKEAKWKKLILRGIYQLGGVLDNDQYFV